MATKALIPMDFSPASQELFNVADQWALTNDAELNFLYVNSSKFHLEQTRQQLEDLVRETGISSPWQCELRVGDPKLEILQEIDRLQIDQVFMLCHDHGFVERALLGSVTEHVVHNSNCPVYVHRDISSSWDNAIMVAVGQTEVSKRLVTLAGGWAAREGAGLHLVTVLPPLQYPYAGDISGAVVQESPENLEQRVHEQQSRLRHLAENLVPTGVYTECSVELNAAAYLGLRDYQEQHRIRLLFIAAHKHSSLGRLLLGSNTDYLLHHLPSPMFIFKDPNLADA